MYRRYRERRYHRHRSSNYNDPTRRLRSTLRRPSTQIGILLVVGLIIFLILQSANQKNNNSTSLPAEISVNEAYTKYQNGAFFLDVRTQEEWDQFHAPNFTLIPLDQLPLRLNEIPKDREIIVVCRPDNCSQQGRNILLNAGFTQVSSMQGGLTDWQAAGYPTTP